MPVQPNLPQRISNRWRRFRYDLGVYLRQQALKERPPGFLGRAVRKTFLASTAATAIGAGAFYLGGETIHDSYRTYIRENPYKLSLKITDRDRANENQAPLYVGSAEVPRIIAMQEDLLTLGYPLSACGANGVFKGAELRAVNMFQSVAGLRQSEYADQKTLGMLARMAANKIALQQEFGTATHDRRTMYIYRPSLFTPSRQEKEEIREIQGELVQLGHDIGSCMFTGEMNPATVKAVEKFQRERMAGQKQADNMTFFVTGEVDPKTRAALHAAAGAAYEQSGTKEIRQKQGIDNASALMYGQPLAQGEMQQLAVKYVREGRAPEYVVQAVLEATEKTGFDFTYLMDMGAIESSYVPWAGAGTTTAVGPFQFLHTTWLGVFGQHGAKYGYGALTKKISGYSFNGNVSAAEQQYIYDLRKDPRASALMAAEFARDNLNYLQGTVGGVINKTDLYMAHFLGAGDAAKFLKAFRADPSQPAAPIFPAAAGSNKGVFYAGDGRALSVGEIYKNFSRKMSSQVLRTVAATKPRSLTDTPAVQAPKPEA